MIACVVDPKPIAVAISMLIFLFLSQCSPGRPLGLHQNLLVVVNRQSRWIAWSGVAKSQSLSTSEYRHDINRPTSCRADDQRLCLLSVVKAEKATSEEIAKDEHAYAPFGTIEDIYDHCGSVEISPDQRVEKDRDTDDTE